MPLTNKFVKDFYFNELEANNISVEYWDISALFFKEFSLPDQCNKKYSTKVLSYSELKNLIVKQDKSRCLFVPQVSFELRVFRLFLLLSRNKCKLGFFARGALPSLSLIKEKQNFSYLRVLHKFYSFTGYTIIYLLKRFKIISTYEYLFNAGEDGYTAIGYGCKIEKIYGNIININSIDFDSYLEEENAINQNLLNEHYGVFLDEYLPYHPDFKMFNKKTIHPKKYFKSLNCFFDSLEQYYNLKIIIAAHPKSDYKSNPFNGRLVLKYKTNELVKYSDFVITHMSTSISFAILYKKPIIFLVTDEYMKINDSTLYNYTKVFAQETGSQIINADNFILEGLRLNEVNMHKYDKYKYRYLTSKETEKKLSCQIIVETLCLR